MGNKWRLSKFKMNFGTFGNQNLQNSFLWRQNHRFRQISNAVGNYVSSASKRSFEGPNTCAFDGPKIEASKSSICVPKNQRFFEEFWRI